jgi:hypothetical protein
MIKRNRLVIFLVVLALATFGLAPVAVAQTTRPYRNNDSYMLSLINRIEQRADRFSNSLENALDRSSLNGTSREDEVNKMLTDFEAATDQLKDRFNRRQSATSDAEEVLRRAAVLDTFMLNNRMTNRSEQDWKLLRNELDQLARSYSVAWRWGQTGIYTPNAQTAYILNDRQMQQLLRRIETSTDRFSNLLPNALDRSRLNNTEREDEVNRLVTDFENATDLLKDRFNRRESTQTDAEMVLQRGSLINTFMRNHQLDYRTESAWTQVRNQLNQLATAYSVARNWATIEWPNTLPVVTNYDAWLTGTFRLNPTASDNPRTVADNAIRNLGYNQRQRIYDNLVSRLTPPEMLSIERRGAHVTLASSRSPQVTFDADGVERAETYPNGRASRVRADIRGYKLTVVSNGDRANDFTATFVPVDNGRLLVTRQVYVERLNHPVLVQSYYDRTADVARWNIYNPGSVYTSSNIGTTSRSFIVPDGAQLVAVLNNNLSTQNARDGERFTMTVRSPAQYDGAVIEGYVTNVSRGGRITGRSEMTLNFDSIRLRDGRTYNFAGFVENVIAANGENVRVDNEGALEEGDSRTNTTLSRTAIGTAVGAIIGAIAGGGRGAAIGAAVGAGAGAGSVYVQGRDDLSLMSGTEVVVRASAPR